MFCCRGFRLLLFSRFQKGRWAVCRCDSGLFPSFRGMVFCCRELLLLVWQAARQHSTGPDLAQHKPKMGPRWLNMGPTWPNMGTTCAQHRPKLLPYRQALRIMPASVQHSPPWVCAENLGPIFPHLSQKSLLGRRPAVRRKPLNI